MHNMKASQANAMCSTCETRTEQPEANSNMAHVQYEFQNQV